MSDNTLSRTLNDIGLAAWFGGTLANAVALNPAASEADAPTRVGAVAKWPTDSTCRVVSPSSGCRPSIRSGAPAPTSGS